MTVALKKQLDESLRDALLALYLNKVAPEQATTKTRQLKTARDLYEYWLLDVLVSQDVPTTPVACAIASLQQYINRILMNLEPGYDPASIGAERLKTWRDEMHQYPTWAAHQKLLYFPATYLDPALRADKSENFRQLENELSQNQIQPDAVQTAVMAYLTRFEEVANLNILNGYIDGSDFANSTYYFIAKSRSENSYFWRSLNMAQRPFDGPPAPAPAIAPKRDQPDPYAWSDWEKADVPIPESAAEQTIRPVWFNNRLFVVWAECIHQDPAASSRVSQVASTTAPGANRPLLRLSYCFKKHDGSWSTPRVGLQGYCEDEVLGSKDVNAIKPLLCTVAEYHVSERHALLFLALGAKTDSKPASADNCKFLKTACIDEHLAVVPYLSATPPINPEIDIKDLDDDYRKRLFDANERRIQTAHGFDLPGSHTNPKLGAFLPLPFLVDIRRMAPTIIEETVNGPRLVQIISFSDSAMHYSDNKKQSRQPIRLNTVFAAELIRRTENSLDELFDWATQHLPEPAVPGDPTNRMDFHGPYGRYFTELFLYLPWLVAHRLNAEQRYEEAERWLRYTFDPGRDREACWRSVPLIDNSMPSYSNQAPHDPHQIALSHPVHFCKALYFLYLDILINRGDATYREMTPDGLSEAKLWYVRVLDLLGPRPVVRPADPWTAISLKVLSDTSDDSLRTFEYALTGLTDQHTLVLSESSSRSSLPTIDSPYLHLPFNPQLLRCWDLAESRLYNLRHNLDMTGKPLHLPIIAAPLDPRALSSANALSLSDSPSTGLPSVTIPHYRFSVMHRHAQNAVESLSQFGTLLLSLIERKEQAQLQELQQQQAWNLAKISVDLQRQALNIERQSRQALLASKAIVQGRASHYKKLLEDNLSDSEKNAGSLYVASGASELAAMTCQIAAGGLMTLPNIFGFSNGGSRWEGPMLAASAAAHSAAIISRTAADQYDRLASFNRRRQEWIQAYDQSQLELAQIDAQLAQFTEQQTATRLQLRLAESTLGQAKAHYDFLSKRFTKAQLYQWLNSQLAALYRQAYDATLSLCLAAEACWQYEIADFDTRFIQPGAWHATYRGLGAGELLKLNLLKMHAGYLQRHERELEIRKTISLQQLKGKTAASSLNKDWAQLHADLKQGGCEFELTHQLFEDDYKDQRHYLRRIKTISVTLPTVVGPYENIRATLTQTASTVFLSPGDQGQAMESWRANQRIALSTGVDDNGLFTLSFNDDRYLPFEYTGAISKWQLTFPNPEAQKDLLESLTDVIVHVSYTARVGGGVQ
ncbi:MULTISPECIES: neuraminidase-like domain-containing protein [unclassified Pseudomonas]|uniref:Tc toxin subunit A-related protein n=1 Tax=unclassified Pseudomonas TaxID=196821 RepID=UPI000CD1D77F|nr:MULTISPECIES: neuraminidase-like domain-containing protein [unclassified Pseudomonas]POA14815.1 toxin [Pseudomonas sp. MPBD7-1]